MAIIGTAFEGTQVHNHNRVLLMGHLDELVRKSIRKDFANANFKRNKRNPKTQQRKNTKRVVSISDSCEYFRYKRYFVGKLVRLVDVCLGGTWVEFVNDTNRLALNRAAGWSDNKRKYLLQGAKFDD